MGEVLESFETSSGDEVYRMKDASGQIRWRSAQTGRLLSNDQIEAVKQNAQRQATKQQNPDIDVSYTVEPTTDEDRQNAVEIRYPEINNTSGLDPRTISSGDSKTNRIKAWMENDALVREIENDPLLQNQRERDRALEARARQLVDDLEGVSNEREAVEVIQKYGYDNVS